MDNGGQAESQTQQQQQQQHQEKGEEEKESRVEELNLSRSKDEMPTSGDENPRGTSGLGKEGGPVESGKGGSVEGAPTEGGAAEEGGNGEEIEYGDETLEGKFEDEIDVKDDALIKFTEHKGPVHCVCVNSDVSLALSGDQEDMALLWDVKTGKVVRELKGHKDTVVDASWNNDESAYATASMDGTIRVYKPNGKVKVLKGPETEIYWFRWHRKGPVIIAGCGDGTMWMWHAMTGKCMQVFAGHSDVVSCGSFSQNGRLAVSGSYDKKAIVWSPKSGEQLHKLEAIGLRGYHTAPLTCITVHHSKPIMVTGAEDGSAWICSLSREASKPLKELKEHKQSVEAAEFSKILDWVFTASADGTIIVSDISTGEVRSKIELQGAVTRALWHPKAPAIYTSGTDALVQLWDARNGTLVRELRGHSDTILALAVSNDGAWVLSAGDDGTCAVFDIKSGAGKLTKTSNESVKDDAGSPTGEKKEQDGKQKNDK